MLVIMYKYVYYLNYNTTETLPGYSQINKIYIYFRHGKELEYKLNLRFTIIWLSQYTQNTIFRTIFH